MPLKYQVEGSLVPLPFRRAYLCTKQRTMHGTFDGLLQISYPTHISIGIEPAYHKVKSQGYAVGERVLRESKRNQRSLAQNTILELIQDPWQAADAASKKKGVYIYKNHIIYMETEVFAQNTPKATYLIPYRIKSATEFCSFFQLDKGSYRRKSTRKISIQSHYISKGLISAPNNEPCMGPLMDCSKSHTLPISRSASKSVTIKRVKPRVRLLESVC